MQTQIHNVTEIVVRKVSRLTDKRRVFYVRDIVVWDDKGRKFELTLFSDEEGGLDLTREGA